MKNIPTPTSPTATTDPEAFYELLEETENNAKRLRYLSQQLIDMFPDLLAAYQHQVNLNLGDISHQTK